MSYDNHFPADGTPYTLPCGEPAVWDNTGWRCLSCMTIYGSMTCPCSESPRVRKDIARPIKESKP